MNRFEIYKSFSKDQKEVIFNLEKEISGSYLAVIIINRQVCTRKIIVQKIEDRMKL